MKAPKFSVIIPTLNEEKFLPALLNSLTFQTDRRFEVIVVDGSSKDQTVKKARTFKKKLPSLRIVISKKASLPLQRNLGAKEARGEWLIFVDADSVFMPYFIERIDVFIKRKDPRVFTTWSQPDSDDPNDAIFSMIANLAIQATIMWDRPLAPGPLTIVRQDIFKAAGGYNEEHAFNEDLELGIRLRERGAAVAMLPEALYVWSLRRMRSEGRMKVAGQYALATVPAMLFKKPLKHMPGYVMGGHVYTKKNQPVAHETLRTYERRLKELFSELFE